MLLYDKHSNKCVLYYTKNESMATVPSTVYLIQSMGSSSISN